MHPLRAETLSSLRQTVTAVDARHRRQAGGAPALALGIEAIDAALGGGLAFGVLHELAPALPVDAGAATGFALALAVRARRQRPVLWIQGDHGCREQGVPYGPGLGLLGFDPARIVILSVARPGDVLWAMEEALRSRALDIAIADMPGERGLDEGITMRRLALAAREAGTLGLFLRPRAAAAPGPAATRWQIAAAPGVPDGLGGLGRTVFALSLTKNRRGPCGRWFVAWDHHDRIFRPALPVGVAEEARDRPDRAPLVRIA